MFNVNDNNDDMFKKEKQEMKNAPKKKDLYDFSDFSHDQSTTKKESKKVSPPTSGGISFHEFEEIFVTEAEAAKESDKKSLKEHFKQNRAAQKELKLEKSIQKQSKKRRKSKRKQREIEDFDDIKKRRAFKYKRKKYTKVEDFINYLNENYKDLDQIAENILNDENFHGWLKRRSKRFDESIADFRVIIEIIGN